MQKLKYSILEKLNDCTQTEIALLLYVGRFQDQTGLVRGVYYKTVVQNLKISIQSFYNAREGLRKKGVISVTKESIPDSDIRILENDFSDENYQCGYIDLQHEIFRSEEFLKSRANEMLLALDLVKNIQSSPGKKHGIRTKTFLEKYKKKFSVTERGVRNYLHTMRKFFNIGLFGKVYYISLKRRCRRDQRPGREGEEGSYRKQLVEAGLRRARIKDAGEKEKNDVLALILQYQKKAKACGEDIGRLLIQAIRESIEIINEGKRRRNYRYIIKPSLIHKLLADNLKMQIF